MAFGPYVLPVAIICGHYYRQNCDTNDETFVLKTQFPKQWPIRSARLDESKQNQQNIYNKCLQSVAKVGTSSTFGTGIIVRTDGLIITNAHVVNDLSFVGISLAKQFTASQLLVREMGTDPVGVIRGQVVYCEPQLDLALVRIYIKPGVLTAMAFPDKPEPKVGQHVMAIGNPRVDYSLELGVINGVDDRGVDVSDSYDQYYHMLIRPKHPYITHTALIKPGYSGGPLIDMSGRLIGVNFAGRRQYNNFAIHSSEVKDFMNRGLEFERQSLEKKCSFVNKKALGVELRQEPQGFRVCGFSCHNSLNNINQLQIDDIVQQINGKELTRIGQLIDALNNMNDNQELRLQVLRKAGNVQNVDIKPHFGDKHITCVKV
ncbi:unnamed protein product [Medioppia subpectinata]|uniref:Serine protease n=1 Tax=Medioppia subpectinata TaxID=1979941 RepID=A0A7R9KPX5_9ACAR|nr:unnamed protein product [Medioppia subpectinata]CAG2107620.1 unnamed protein product [Medioppia subpectinata]